MSDFQSLVGRLLEQGVEFVIVGGYAAVAHGSSMLTQDMDICCRFNPDNLMRLQKALRGLKPVHRMTTQRLPLKLTEKSAASLLNLYLDTTFGQLDCLGSITGLGDFDEVLRRSMIIDWFGQPCRILSVDALIKSKKAMGSTKDLETVRQLEALRKIRKKS